MSKQILFNGHYGNPHLKLEEDFYYQQNAGRLSESNKPLKENTSYSPSVDKQETGSNRFVTNTLLIEKSPVYISQTQRFINRFGENYLRGLK